MSRKIPIIKRQYFYYAMQAPNGLCNWRWGGLRFGLRAGKTRSQRSARKSRRFPSVQCTWY